MKKMLVLSIILTCILISSHELFAQTSENGDTLFVGPLNSQGVALGSLNEAIKADTTAAGERAHSVYKLQHNAQYILTEVIQADFPLVIVADKPNDANRPPVIRCGLKEDGSAVDDWWVLYNGATFINLWLTAVNLDGTGPISWISQQVNGEKHRYVYDGCVIEYPYTWWAMFADWGLNNTYVLTNNIFQYIGNPAGATWNGAIFSGGTMDTVILKNNTFFDFGCYAFNGQAFYLEIDHNTLVNCMLHPIMSHSKIIGKYTNNLFVNCHAFSDDQDEIRRHHDAEVKGLMNYAETQWNKELLDSLYGPGGVYGKNYDPNGDGTLTEGELVWELKNNNWWYTQPIKDYWAQFSQISPNPWMNRYNQAMFDSSKLTSNWTWNLTAFIWADSAGTIVPNPSSFDGLHVVDSIVVPVTHEPFRFFVEENTTNVDPGIKDMNNCDELLAENCINIRESQYTGASTPSVSFHGVSDYLAFTWPLDYDLSYTNTTLQTGGTDDKPVGSSQWWPDNGTSVQGETAIPNAFVLEQNYPNPFNPSTKINYSVPNSGYVTLKVFNILGQEIATLFSGQLNTGNYAATFDGSKFAGGVYFYRLEAGETSITKKLILLK
ncbi:MAG: T9SS type A sorting domain-containing protein [Bacteroidetes bacterium]|nr:T9SS type A sorting domain-containing protein [Bacteroidota bacterium]